MRNGIIGLSIFFFSLSAIIAYKTLNIPSATILYQNNPQELKQKEPSSKSGDSPEPDAKERQSSGPNVEKSPVPDTGSGNKNAESEERTRSNTESAKLPKDVRILAVFGEGTFRSGQFDVTNSLETAVQKLFSEIPSSPDYRIVIEGHTDNTRPSAGRQYTDNTELSSLRANAVAHLLIKNGVSRTRISVVGYGDTRPVGSNDTAEGRAKNRRVEVKIIPAGKGL